MSSPPRTIGTLQAQAQQLNAQFQPEIEDFRSIARLHDFATGQPAHLAALPGRLSQDARLRSDFSELVRALQAGNPDFSLADALTVLTLSIGGVSALGRNPSLDEPKSLLGGFLASLGRWPGADDQPITDLDNPPDHDPRLDLQLEARQLAAAEAEAARQLAAAEAEAARQQASAAAEAARLAAAQTADMPFLPQDDPEPDTPPSAPVTTPSEDAALARLTEVLARLERGNVELRLHLDSIDQRISRMEPMLESAPHPHEPAPRSSRPTDDPPPPAAAATPASTPAAEQELPLVHRDTHDPAVSPVPQRPARVTLEPASLAEPSREPAPAKPVASSAKAPVEAPSAPPAIPSERIALEPLVVPAPEPAAPAPPSAAPAARAATPRRERFAAARDLPGFRQEVLGSATDPAPELDALLPEPAPAPAAAAAPAPSPAATSAATPPLFASVSSGKASATDDSETPKSRKGLVVTVAVILFVALISFFFVFGSPLALFHRDQPAATQPPVSPRPSSETAPAPRSSAAEPAARSPQTTPKSANGRVLGAREAYAPTQSTEDLQPQSQLQTTTSPTFVPEAVMDGYLLSAPRPVYPRMANLVGVSGRIVFEAMISKEGTIESVKALGGNRLLRDAATNAVRQWEYRPFLVKGNPVEVRTIVRVDVTPNDSE